MNRNLVLLALILSTSLACSQAPDEESADSAVDNGAIGDALIVGKLEAVYALNTHLSAFAIDTDAEDGIVHLTGTVESDIERDLAGEIAAGIEGVVDVDNDLVLETGARQAAEHNRSGERSFGAWVDDATTTASVKSSLLANPNTKGLQIDVDTRGDVVTLTGEVASAEEKQLAEELTRNTGDVKGVRNQLIVRAS
jgi:osmotically-inducible protein OsmY